MKTSIGSDVPTFDNKEDIAIGSNPSCLKSLRDKLPKRLDSPDPEISVSKDKCPSLGAEEPKASNSCICAAELVI